MREGRRRGKGRGEGREEEREGKRGKGIERRKEEREGRRDNSPIQSIVHSMQCCCQYHQTSQYKVEPTWVDDYTNMQKTIPVCKHGTYMCVHMRAQIMCVCMCVWW